MTEGCALGRQRVKLAMQWDVIWSRARADLVIPTKRGDEDVFLWEHSSRVARNAREIIKLPSVHLAGPDEVAVVSAALYHEAGWIARLNRGEINRLDILVQDVREDHGEEGASLLERSLANLLPGDSIARATHAIRSMADGDSSCIEAQVLRDADHLDEFGIISLWTTVRRGLVDGKGLQAAIDTWRRRKEYRFWDARLKDSFRFPAVQTIARRRLAELDLLMQEFDRQQQAADILGERGG